MLVGREGERAKIDELIVSARVGKAGTLVVSGDAGIGKTALLEYAIEQADGMTVVRALGVETEAELEFSALHELCRPLLDVLPEIPERQADALRGALGLSPAEVADRFTIGAATLSLLAAAAEQQPLLVAVDDAQWLDRSSADALVFATRRLEADRCCLIFACRAGEERTFAVPGAHALGLTGLPHDDAAQLLGPEPVSPAVADVLVRATEGNPLALLEARRLLSAGQLSGREPLPDPLPAGETIERALMKRVEALPEETQKALLLASTSASMSVEAVLLALRHVGLEDSSLEPAEDAGLVLVADGRLTFRHPLVRSAMYHGAAPSERRAAHRAFGEALVDAGRPEERAWHVATAALGPDEEVAAELSGPPRARSGAPATRPPRGRWSVRPTSRPTTTRGCVGSPRRRRRRGRQGAPSIPRWPCCRSRSSAAASRAFARGSCTCGTRSNVCRGPGPSRRSRTFAPPPSRSPGRSKQAVAILVDASEAAIYGADLEASLAAAERARELAPADGGARTSSPTCCWARRCSTPAGSRTATTASLVPGRPSNAIRLFATALAC